MKNYYTLSNLNLFKTKRIQSHYKMWKINSLVSKFNIWKHILSNSTLAYQGLFKVKKIKIDIYIYAQKIHLC